MKEAKLVYILAPGHSGSTLLDILIGQIPDIFSSGELRYLPWQVYRNLNNQATMEVQDICTCKKSFLECDFWSEVTSLIELEKKIKLTENPFDFNISIHEDQKYFSRRGFVSKINRKMYFWFNPLFKKMFNIHFRTSIENNWCLFDKMAQVSKSTFIVDSTKDPIRFQQLSSVKGRKIFPIVLIRDVHGVASSGYNYNKKVNLMKNANSWLLFYNKKVRQVIKNKKYIVIKYEEISQDPILILNKIADYLGINEEVKFSDEINTDKLHIVAGNPMRYKNPIKIRHDETWKNRLSEDEQLLLTKINNKNYFLNLD